MPKSDKTLMPADGFMRNKAAQAVNAAHGAQNGWMTNPANYDANESYVKQDLIPVVLECPRGFQDLPEPEEWVRALKTLMEDSPKLIEGLNSTLTPEFAETPFGGAGEVMHSVVDMKRAPSEPSYTWDEKRGKYVQNFLEQWGLMLMMDPESKKPGVISLPGNESKEIDLSPSYRAATVLYIEPSLDMKSVVNAWLCVNMMPKSFGENTGKRDLNSAKEVPEHSVAFTCTTDCSRGTFAIAQRVLDSLRLTGMASGNRTPIIDGIQADVEAIKSGLIDRMEDMQSASVYSN